ERELGHRADQAGHAGNRPGGARARVPVRRGSRQGRHAHRRVSFTSMNSSLSSRRRFLGQCGLAAGFALASPRRPLLAADPAAAPVEKITPGKVVVPFRRMRRPWGELISLDLEKRTGTFRQESNDEIVNFTVLPYAELYHHAA